MKYVYLFFMKKDNSISLIFRPTDAKFSESRDFTDNITTPSGRILHCSPIAIYFNGKINVFYLNDKNEANVLSFNDLELGEPLYRQNISYSIKQLFFEASESIVPSAHGERVYLFFKNKTDDTIKWAIYDDIFSIEYAIGDFSNLDITTGDYVSIVKVPEARANPYLFWSQSGQRENLFFCELIMTEKRVSCNLAYSAKTAMTYSPSAIYCDVDGKQFILVFHQGENYSRELRCYHMNMWFSNKPHIREDGDYPITYADAVSDGGVIKILTSPGAISVDPLTAVVYYVDSDNKRMKAAFIEVKKLECKHIRLLNGEAARANTSPYAIYA